MGSYGRRRVAEELQWAKVGQNLVTAYETLLNREIKASPETHRGKKFTEISSSLALPFLDKPLHSDYPGFSTQPPSEIFVTKPEIRHAGIVDVTFGKTVTVVQPVNLYGCTIGDGSFIGPFVEIQKGVTIGNGAGFNRTHSSVSS